MNSSKLLKELADPLTLLYVEDEEMLRDSMTNTLGKLFKKVYSAKNGQEALDIYKKEEIDLVLTDINMPVLNGVELVKNINEITDNPNIIVLSAHNESELLMDLINLGITSFINKPVEKDILIKILYKSCSIINDKRLIEIYEHQLEEENEAILRKNRILEQKLNQLASKTNIINDCPHEFVNVEKKYIGNYYETLLREDIDELHDLSEELETYVMMMFQNSILNAEYIEMLGTLYKKYASVLNLYSEFSEISSLLTYFANIMPSLENKFLNDINQTGIYLESLQ
ncbi:response regulator, partial [Sulfurimonas sp. SAG-AH-194-C20]